MTRVEIERSIGKLLVHGWTLDGPGKARFGWGSVHPSKIRWEGRTLADIAGRLRVAALDDYERGEAMGQP